MAKHLRKPIKYTLYIIMGWAAVVTLFLLFQTVGKFLEEVFAILKTGDQAQLIAYISGRSAFGGMFILYVMAVLQVVSVVLPGMLIQVSGALIFGWWKAFIICWCGFVSGNALVFCAARIMGKSLTDTLNLDSKNTWLVKQMNSRDPAFVTALACMIPGVPNGIIPYIASRTKLYLNQYVKAVAKSCWIQILLNCIAGHFLVRGEFTFSIFAISLQICILLVIARYRDRILSYRK